MDPEGKGKNSGDPVSLDWISQTIVPSGSNPMWSFGFPGVPRISILGGGRSFLYSELLQCVCLHCFWQLLTSPTRFEGPPCAQGYPKDRWIPTGFPRTQNRRSIKVSIWEAHARSCSWPNRTSCNKMLLKVSVLCKGRANCANSCEPTSEQLQPPSPGAIFRGLVVLLGWLVGWWSTGLIKLLSN